jgi:hypothetical protein
VVTYIHSASSDTSDPKTAIMDMPDGPPALKFITLTDKPATQQSNFSYLVRSHAMQSVVHERRNPALKSAASASQRAADAEIKTSKELSGKFKLNTWKKKRRRKKTDSAEEVEEDAFGNVADEAAIFAEVGKTDAVSLT